MDTLLLVLQALLALHTLMGAVWKFTNTVEAVPTLRALGNTIWRSLGVVELVLVVALTLPLFVDGLGWTVAIGAFGVVVEMLLYCGVHLASGSKERGALVYWLVVAALSTGLGTAGLV
ncbi:MAG TPA: DoxX family protein [Myxococcota bacterium]|nr:DoxX family protein [Myxococcota bacterium]